MSITPMAFINPSEYISPPNINGNIIERTEITAV